MRHDTGGASGGWPWRDSCLSGGGAWGPCGLSICGGGEARTQPPDTGKEVTTHNGGYSGEALRAHSRPPGPGARAGWRPAALYIALCRGYRTAGAELVSFASHTGRAVLRRVRSCDDQEHTPQRQGRERAELLHGWQRCGAGELCEPLGSRFGWQSLKLEAELFFIQKVIEFCPQIWLLKKWKHVLARIALHARIPKRTWKVNFH